MVEHESLTSFLRKCKKNPSYANKAWYDWFCRDSSLSNKSKKLLPKVKQISESIKINPDKCYVFFKNNCPYDGPLYDDFRICDLKNGDVIYTIVPCRKIKAEKDRHIRHHKVKMSTINEVWGRENKFSKPLVEGSWADIRKFFKV